jgi:predicted DNA-binding transcriptional regulator YafY
VDRVQRLEPTARRFKVPESFDFDAYLGSSFGVIAEPAVQVKIRFDKRWATYVSEHTWHASQQLAPGPDGGVEVSMQVGGTAELRAWVLSFGAAAEVLEPEALRSEVVKELAGAVARYRGG